MARGVSILLQPFHVVSTLLGVPAGNSAITGEDSDGARRNVKGRSEAFAFSVCSAESVTVTLVFSVLAASFDTNTNLCGFARTTS